MKTKKYICGSIFNEGVYVIKGIKSGKLIRIEEGDNSLEYCPDNRKIKC